MTVIAVTLRLKPEDEKALALLAEPEGVETADIPNGQPSNNLG